MCGVYVLVLFSTVGTKCLQHCYLHCLSNKRIFCVYKICCVDFVVPCFIILFSSFHGSVLRGSALRGSAILFSFFYIFLFHWFVLLQITNHIPITTYPIASSTTPTTTSYCICFLKRDEISCFENLTDNS